MNATKKGLSVRLKRSLGMMEILEAEVHNIYIWAISQEDHSCEKEATQALRQQSNLRKEIRVLRRFLNTKKVSG